jgi:hypothetical protein
MLLLIQEETKKPTIHSSPSVETRAIGRDTCVTLILNTLHTTAGKNRRKQAVYLNEIKNIIVINVFIIVNNAQKLTGYVPSAYSIASKLRVRKNGN